MDARTRDAGSQQKEGCSANVRQLHAPIPPQDASVR
jgi:hypothetical protein